MTAIDTRPVIITPTEDEALALPRFGRDVLRQRVDAVVSAGETDDGQMVILHRIGPYASQQAASAARRAAEDYADELGLPGDLWGVSQKSEKYDDIAWLIMRYLPPGAQ